MATLKARVEALEAQTMANLPDPLAADVVDAVRGVVGDLEIPSVIEGERTSQWFTRCSNEVLEALVASGGP